MNEPSKPRRSAIGMKRIRRSSDKEQIIELLTSEAVGAFREMWRLMFFAAMVGFKNRRREPLAAVQAGEGIRQDSFANNPVWAGSLQLLALVELGSAEALRGTEEAEDERIRVFEEYANGGLAILKETFDATDSSLDGLLAFVQAQTSPSPPTTPELNVSI